MLINASVLQVYLLAHDRKYAYHAMCYLSASITEPCAQMGGSVKKG